MLVVVSVLYASDLPMDQWFLSRLIPIVLFFALVFYAALMIGLLIVREERAVQTSHELARYVTEVEEIAMLRERNRLAREIHDNLGHYLTAVNMQIEAAMAVLDTDQERTRQALTKAQTLTKEGLSEIRRSINALRANPIENRALHEAILLLVEEHRAAGYAVDYYIQGDIRPCSAAVEMALYRIAQEGLTNIRKHAQATRADLSLSYQDASRVCLEVRDDGVGSAQPNGGFGLLGIRERVQLLGGTFTVNAASGQGFTLQVGIPV
jgi:signal transduction histidine kinase